MTIYKLTTEQVGYLSDHRDGVVAMRIIDALTAENERLRAELRSSNLTADHVWAMEANMHEADAERDAAEARLATAVGLLTRWEENCGKFDETVLPDTRAFLANQPAAPACGSCRDMKVWSNGLLCPVCQPAATALLEWLARELPGAYRGQINAFLANQPAAPTYATAAQSASELMARVHSAPTLPDEPDVDVSDWRRVSPKPAAPIIRCYACGSSEPMATHKCQPAAPTRFDFGSVTIDAYHQEHVAALTAPARTEAEQRVLDACSKMALDDDNREEDEDPLEPSEHGEDCYIYTDDQYAIAKAELALRGLK